VIIVNSKLSQYVSTLLSQFQLFVLLFGIKSLRIVFIFYDGLVAIHMYLP